MTATTRMITRTRSCDADDISRDVTIVTLDDVTTSSTFFKNDYVVKTRNPERFLKLRNEGIRQNLLVTLDEQDDDILHGENHCWAYWIVGCFWSIALNSNGWVRSTIKPFGTVIATY